jgi:hypothetical protein
MHKVQVYIYVFWYFINNLLDIGNYFFFHSGCKKQNATTEQIINDNKAYLLFFTYDMGSCEYWYRE